MRYSASSPDITAIPSTLTVKIPGGKRIRTVSLSYAGAPASLLAVIGDSSDITEQSTLEIISVLSFENGGRWIFNGNIFSLNEQFVKAYIGSTVTGGGWSMVVNAE